MYPQYMYPQYMYPQHMYPQYMYPQYMYPQYMYPQYMYPQHMYPQHMYPQHMYPQYMYPQHMYSQYMYPGGLCDVCRLEGLRKSKSYSVRLVDMRRRFCVWTANCGGGNVEVRQEVWILWMGSYGADCRGCGERDQGPGTRN